MRVAFKQGSPAPWRSHFNSRAERGMGLRGRDLMRGGLRNIHQLGAEAKAESILFWKNLSSSQIKSKRI